MKKNKNLLIILIVLVFIANTFFGNMGAQARQKKENFTIDVDGVKYDIRVLNHEYDNNLYLSINDMARALYNTRLSFVPVWNKENGSEKLILQTIDKNSYVDEEGFFSKKINDGMEVSEDSIDENSDIVFYDRRRMTINIGGNDYAFYAIPVNSDDEKDMYINIGELAISMDLDLSVSGDSITINPNSNFNFEKVDFEASGLPFMADSCIVGDITNNNIYYEMNGNEQVSIASTTKLMTYLVIREAMDKGSISSNDIVCFSKNAEELSGTSNGVIPVKENDTAYIMDVIKGMLISSSNECALALAEHLSGTEEEFVKLMNEKAKEIGLSEDTMFYDAHGLPLYSDDVLSVKRQNHMSALDMFKLVTYIMTKYPEITDITSLKETTLTSLNNYNAKNTNQLLYNVPGCVGLKTGTTDKAQSCLVSACEIKDINGENHYIVSIVYGAENAQTQSYTSMVLMKYGIFRFDKEELGIIPQDDKEFVMPDNLESLVDAVINVARNK